MPYSLAYSHGYPVDWETTFMWHDKLSVHFGYPSHGWTLLSLLGAFNGSVVIHLSDVFDPFVGMVNWLKAIDAGQLPATLRINEDGSHKELVVKPYAGRFADLSDIEFRVTGDAWNPDQRRAEIACYYLGRGTRSQLLGEFCRRLEAWLREDYYPPDWDDRGGDWWDEAEDGPRPDLRRNLDMTWLRETAARHPTPAKFF